jgi:hypothetical protein
MSSSGRRRASWLVLLVLAAGFLLAAAAAASAASAHEMACCPDEAANERGCAWLGAGDCCPERPAAPAPLAPNGAPPASATSVVLALPPAFDPETARLAPSDAAAPHRSRSAVLRL